MRGRASAISSSFARLPLAEDVGKEGLDEVGVLLNPVGVAGGRVGEHPEGHAIGIGKVGKPLGHGVVERQASLVLELKQEVDDVGDRDRADPEMHPTVAGTLAIASPAAAGTTDRSRSSTRASAARRPLSGIARSTIARTSRPAAAELVQPDAVRMFPPGKELIRSTAAAELDASRAAQIVPARAMPPATCT